MKPPRQEKTSNNEEVWDCLTWAAGRAKLRLFKREEKREEVDRVGEGEKKRRRERSEKNFGDSPSMPRAKIVEEKGRMAGHWAARGRSKK